jgi:hypothetical protein
LGATHSPIQVLPVKDVNYNLYEVVGLLNSHACLHKRETQDHCSLSTHSSFLKISPLPAVLHILLVPKLLLGNAYFHAELRLATAISLISLSRAKQIFVQITGSQAGV